jgi:predicted alpha-1,2-mannosidase
LRAITIKNMTHHHKGLILVFYGLALFAQATEPVDWVNPFIGTTNKGNTFPGALRPWGMVSVSPHNDLQAPSGYIHGQPFLYGFGHIHLSGADCPDLGSLLLMPTVGKVECRLEKRKSSYGSESASPGYYRAHLKTSDILAEMTAGARSGMSQYTFPARKGDANILVDVSHRLTSDPVTLKTEFQSRVKIISNTEMEGWCQSGNFCSPFTGNRQTVYFVLQFSKPAVQAGTWKDGVEKEGELEQSGKSVGAFFRFSTADQESIIVKAGLSYSNVQNARLNLKRENPGWDFQAVKDAARKEWNRELSKIEVKGGSDDRLRVFYTALYHALIHPNVFSDVNGEYQAMGGQGVKFAKDYTRYSTFSLWSTYRTLHPFLGLFYPERQLDMAKSLVEISKESRNLPRFELAGNETNVMVGSPAVPVILSTYRQGLKGFDLKSAYEAAVNSLTPGDNKTYGGLRSLLQYGYIPKDDDSKDLIWGSVSTSLEYAYEYWCLAELAKELHRDEDHERYIQLSGIYRNLYDPTTGFFRAKNRNGSWMEPFDPQAKCCDQSWPDNGGPGYVQGDAWQYLFAVPQDMDGLKRLHGGDEAFVKRLREYFEGSHYDASNEPDLAYPYLFNYSPKESWRSQRQARAILDQFYGTGPEGLPGNDDGGALSAWYLFSALGFYPVCPGSNEYQIGSPVFKQVTVHLNQAYYPGALLTLKTINNSDKNIYVQSLLVNGLPYKKNFLSHETLVFGKTVVFRMENRPALGSSADSIPTPVKPPKK